MKELAFLDKKVIDSILKKTKRIKELEIISFPELYKHLGKKETELVQTFLKLNPQKYGFKGILFGMEEVPRNLVIIRNQKYFSKKGKKKCISDQYLSLEVWLAHWRMNGALNQETGRKLLISSGYRTPAYQTFVFFYYLKKNNFHFLKTMKEVAFPGYSDHGNLAGHAIDLMTPTGIPDDPEFEKTREYKWLIKNAIKFGFYLSYPKDNKKGIIFEPWHWCYEK